MCALVIGIISFVVLIVAIVIIARIEGKKDPRPCPKCGGTAKKEKGSCEHFCKNCGNKF